jgi:hypothetical protein
VLRALIYDDREDLVKRLVADKDLGVEEFFYLGFHFSEEGEDMRPFSTAMLEHVVKKYPRSKVAGPATQKLELHAKALEAAREAEAVRAEAARKKELRQQRAEEKAARQAGAVSSKPAAAASPAVGGVARPAAVSRGKAAAAPSLPVRGSGGRVAGGHDSGSRVSGGKEGKVPGKPARPPIRAAKSRPSLNSKGAGKKKAKSAPRKPAAARGSRGRR